MVMSFKHYNDVTETCGCFWFGLLLYLPVNSYDHVRTSCSCGFFTFPMGQYRVCEIECSHMGKNSGNLDLVCRKECGRIPCVMSTKLNKANIQFNTLRMEKKSTNIS